MIETEPPYTYIIGLEIHAELSTTTKMFCRCLNDPFRAKPNQHICPICAGLPGTLPVPNQEAVKKTILVGKALGSKINKRSKWDRKHYFYPDLPKGYQISQYDLPLCLGGELALLGPDGNPSSTIRFERIHLEEDAGKLMHTGRPGFSKVDLNRAGVPLIEMVTKPDLRSPEEARRFMQEVRLLVRTLGVSEADMEKGQMRADVNLSLEFQHDGEKINTPITEIKNVNSTRAVERSLLAEGQRLYAEWMAGGPVRERKNKLTAGWDEDNNSVNINRAKEEAHEYRYFPEPDIPPLEVYEIKELNPDGMQLPELPNQRRQRYLQLGIAWPDLEVLLSDSVKLSGFEELVARGLPAKQTANWIMNAPECLALSSSNLKSLIELVAGGELGFAVVKQRLSEIIQALETENITLLEVVERLGLLQRHDQSMVQSAIAEVLQEQEQAVQQYKDGKVQILGFLVGQVLKKVGQGGHPAKIQEALQAALQEILESHP